MSDCKVVIIGEPGSTHEGRVDYMEAAIDTAADAGAQAVKFQCVSRPDRLAARRRAPMYEQAYRLIQTPSTKGWEQAVRQRADARGVSVGCTVYLPEDVEPALAWCDFLKISSFEAEAKDIYDALSQAQDKIPIGFPVYVSVGLMPEHQVTSFIQWLYALPGYITYRVLHCISAYPALCEDMQLSQLSQWWCYGLSDHTKNMITGAVAVGAGAKALEVHYHATPFTSSTNPDGVVSWTREELTRYIQAVHTASALMGDGPRVVGPEESLFQRYKVRE